MIIGDVRRMDVGMVMSTKLDITSVIFIGVSSVTYIQNMILRINGIAGSVRTLNWFLQHETLAYISHGNNVMQESSLFHPIHNRCLCFDDSWV